MKNLKIRTKLLATFMLVIILFIGTVAIAIYVCRQTLTNTLNFTM